MITKFLAGIIITSCDFVPAQLGSLFHPAGNLEKHQKGFEKSFRDWDVTK